MGVSPASIDVVLKPSAPEILQRPAPQPGALLFGAPRPERPSAPANPDPASHAGGATVPAPGQPAPRRRRQRLSLRRVSSCEPGRLGSPSRDRPGHLGRMARVLFQVYCDWVRATAVAAGNSRVVRYCRRQALFADSRLDADSHRLALSDLRANS